MKSNGSLKSSRTNAQGKQSSLQTNCAILSIVCNNSVQMHWRFLRRSLSKGLAKRVDSGRKTSLNYEGKQGIRFSNSFKVGLAAVEPLKQLDGAGPMFPFFWRIHGQTLLFQLCPPQPEHHPACVSQGPALLQLVGQFEKIHSSSFSATGPGSLRNSSRHSRRPPKHFCNFLRHSKLQRRQPRLYLSASDMCWLKSFTKASGFLPLAPSLLFRAAFLLAFGFGFHLALAEKQSWECSVSVELMTWA